MESDRPPAPGKAAPDAARPLRHGDALSGGGEMVFYPSLRCAGKGEVV